MPQPTTKTTENPWPPINPEYDLQAAHLRLAQAMDYGPNVYLRGSAIYHNNDYFNRPPHDLDTWKATTKTAQIARKGRRLKPSTVNVWQRIAFEICRNRPDVTIEVSLPTPHMEYQIRCRGEYVEFSLPYPHAGGPKAMITRNGKTKILVSED